MKIALDVVSGEYPAKELVFGALSALEENKNVTIVLVGNKDRINHALKENKLYPVHKERVSIKHTDEIIGMTETPSIAIKKKKNASVMVAARMVGRREADAFFSPGNTGATLASAITEIGRLKNVIRPPLVSVIPRKNGEFYLLDIGANVDCNYEYILQFAIMGGVLSRKCRGVSNPRVGLLNIGEEDYKGNMFYKKVFEKMEKLNINFIGNIEPHDMLKEDKADVVVTDGFSGNLVLKSLEGGASLVASFLKEEIMSSTLVNKIAAMFMKPVFKKLKSKVSADSYGSALLLGLNGGAFVGHGRTTALGVKNAIHTMYNFCNNKVNESIVKELHKSGIKKGIF